MAVEITFTLNQRKTSVRAEPRMLLSDMLRHEMGVTSVHVGCEQGVCGTCTVLLDGEPARSCLMLGVMAHGHAVTTVEGLRGPRLDRLQAAFQTHHGVQCGYCTPAMLLTAYRLLDHGTVLSEADIRNALSGNLCRCTGYQSIVRAVAEAARIPAGEAAGGTVASEGGNLHG
jgi:carbon-monoxide dehydrogenase small subunit